MSVVKKEKPCTIIWKFKNSNATWVLFVQMLFSNVECIDFSQLKNKNSAQQYENSRIQMQPEFYLSICFSIMYNILVSSVKKEKPCTKIWKFKSSNATWVLFAQMLFSKLECIDVSQLKKWNSAQQYENSRILMQPEFYLSICFSIMYNISMSSV